MANFFDIKYEPNTDHDPGNIEIPQGGTAVIGLYGGAGEDRGYSDLFVSSTDPDVVRCDVVKKLARAKSTYYNQYDLSKIDTDEVRKSNNRRYFQLVGLKEGTAQIQATLDAVAIGANQYSGKVSVTVTKDDRFLNLGAPFATLLSKYPEDDPCDARWLAGQCAVRMGVMLQDSSVSLAGLVGNKCGQGAGHSAHFIDPNDIGRWLTAKAKPYVWKASAAAPEPMPGVAARAFVEGKTGIVMFLDFWGPSKDAAPTLDHMDVWNKDTQQHGAETYFLRSREVQFWQIR